MSPIPLCGFPFTDQLRHRPPRRAPRPPRCGSPRPHSQGPADLCLSGRKDPVGANIRGVDRRPNGAGFTRLTTRIYPGARHETLNETNRDEVTRDLIAWLDGVVGRL